MKAKPIKLTEEVIEDIKTLPVKEVISKYNIGVNRLTNIRKNLGICNSRNKSNGIKEVPKQDFLIKSINNSININGINIETSTKEIWISLDKGKLNVRW